MKDDIKDSYQFIVTAIDDKDLTVFQETVEAKDVLEAQVKFQEKWPLAVVNSIQKHAKTYSSAELT